MTGRDHLALSSRPHILHPRAGRGRFSWLAPMALWPLAQWLIPEPTQRPQGGGTRRADDETMFAAVVFVLASGAPWRALPKSFGVSWQTAHRRFGQWSGEGLWERLSEAARNPRVPAHVLPWAVAMTEAAAERLRSAASEARDQRTA